MTLYYQPKHTLFTLLAIGGLLAGLVFVFPDKGISVFDDLTITYPSVEELFLADAERDTMVGLKDSIGDFLTLYTVEIDSIMLGDSLKENVVESIKKQQSVLKIQYADSNVSVLNNFFSALNLVDRFPVRILHYGDSQIEGDRMTGYLRNEFQKQFGGTGCGLVPIFETFRTFAINQSNSDNWKRHAAFFTKNKNPSHQRFGIMANYSRFNDVVADSLLNEKEPTLAWVRFSPNKKGYHRNAKFNKVRMLYGYNRLPVAIRVFANDVLVIEDTLPPTQNTQSVVWSLAKHPSDFKIEFQGVDSPDIYGVSLESPAGVHMDNLGMRGSSGTFFTKLNRTVLKNQYAELEPNLILLQYGGNTVPSIHSKKKAEEYGQWFAVQIRLLKRLNPNASFIVIGPSDMSVEIDGKLQTRKFLEDVRDALKKAAFENGCGFWDLYEVMGGKNSMIAWVQADPPLAAYDYTHFAPGGAKKITKLFYTTLMDDYELWKSKLP